LTRTVLALAYDVPDRRRDLPGGKQARCHLIQQGLEQVVVPPVDQGDIDRLAPQPPGGGQATEPSANDHDAMTWIAIRVHQGRSISCSVPTAVVCDAIGSAEQMNWSRRRPASPIWDDPVPLGCGGGPAIAVVMTALRSALAGPVALIDQSLVRISAVLRARSVEQLTGSISPIPAGSSAAPEG
jgi:hypothetical protein